jgi:L-fuconolactonase
MQSRNTHPPARVRGMEIIDSHCHVSPVWFEPVDTLLHQMQQNEVAQAVLTQLLGQLDNGYQQECLARFPGRFASVVAVDPADPAAIDALRALASAGASGVRLRPESRSPGPDPYAIWRLCEACGLAVSCVGPAAGFLAPTFADLVAVVPRVSIVLEHLGGWARPDCDASEATRAGIRELARFANLFLKVSPLGQMVKRAAKLPAAGRSLPLESAHFVLELLECFGPERLMWGSDFPVVCSREGYANALHWSIELTSAAGAAAQAEMFGGTARRVFRLSRS